ncbi:MAG: hypothetical protein K2W85_16865 [Phycisphaerales bacterium]|nr:hypothetical protein [Phycisphaerales bacterium]
MSRSPPIALLAKLFGKSPAPVAPELYLGAFGKHPGWNDHIDDLGLETQRLVDLKTVMYIEGISAAVDAGKWDKLDPDAQIDGFGHVALLRIRGDIILARLWSSSDGKGRTKYPMVVAAQCTGVTLDWAVQRILPELESVQQRCQSVSTAAEVVAIIDSARATLRAALTPSAANSGSETAIPATLIDELAAHSALGPSAQGLHRILYQLSREAGDYHLGAMPTSKMGAPDKTVTHLRVPELSSDRSARSGAGDDLLAYAKLLLTKLEPWAPTLLIAPLNKPFIDILVGEPSGQSLYCLRAAEKAIPLSTEIPYTLDPQFLADIAAWKTARRELGEVTIMPPPPSVLKKSAGSAGRFRAPVDLWSLAVISGMAISAAQALAPAAHAQTTQPAASSAPDADQPAFQEPRRRYNELLRRLSLDLATADDAKARELVDTFATSAQVLPGGIAFLAEVQSTLTRLRAALDGTGASAPRAPDSALKLGPASTGQFLAQRDGELLRFVPASGAQLPTLTFAPVRIAGREKLTYFSIHEVSVQAVAQIAALSPTGELAIALTSFDRFSDPRRGPRSWEWNKARDAIIPASAWLTSASADRVGPSADVPIQYLSPSAAAYFANLVACRLPTAAEWSAALAASRSDPATPCNLRDKAFDAFAAQARISPSDLDAFAPGEARPAADPAQPSDDTVWFWPVTKGCGTPFKNLVGNVAEYVLDPAPDAPATPPSTTNRFRAVDEWVNAKGNSIAVIGSSALSSSAPDQFATRLPVEIALAGEGYSDVGFRLAFTATADAAQAADPTGSSGGSRVGSAADRARRAIDPLPLLQVR